MQLLEIEKRKKKEERRKMKEEVRLKNEARKRAAKDMKVSINDLGSTKNYKTLSSTKEVHEYIEKHGLAKYSKMILAEKEKLKHIGTRKQTTSLK